MNENETEILDSTNETETTENEVVEETQTDEPQEDVEALKKKIQTLEAQKDHWKTKANKPVETKGQVQTVSNKDFIALMNSKIHEDDIAIVEKFAKMDNISIADALKSTDVKAILATREEMRTTANASNTGKVRTGNSKISEESLLDKASKGEMPQGDDDITRLIKARKGIK